MTIHELAERSGLTAATIRYYEKEGLLDGRHVARQRNNYRTYSDDAPARLALIKKLQSVGFTLAELRDALEEPDGRPPDNLRVIERIRAKISEITRKRDEYEQILATLAWMLEYRVALSNDPAHAERLMRSRREDRAARSRKANAAD